MPVNGNDTREIINPPFTTFPYPTVGVVDSRYKLDNPNGGRPEYDTGRSSGIFITPNHVLTAGHSVYKRGFEQAWAIRVTPSNDQNDLDSRILPIINPPRNVSNSGVNYLYSYNNGQAKKDDIALLTTNQPLLPANDSVGIIAFVNPQNAIEKIIRTAGYPGDNISLPDYSGRGEARDLVLSPSSAYDPGSIIGV